MILVPNVIRQLFVIVSLCLLSLFSFASEEVIYYHNDALGSPVAATDESGSLVWREEYEPYGERLIKASASVENDIWFTGKQEESEFGLQYFQARWYDPELGVFLSRDPVGFVASSVHSFNRYAYANNNPYAYVDPDGEFANFALKFVVDVGINVAFNYVTTGELNVASAVTESALGVLNPAKTAIKAKKLAQALKANKSAPKPSANLAKAKNSPCPMSCFVAGTEILTEDGYVAIEQLKAGDMVWAHDPDTGVTALKPIVRRFVNTKDSVWELRFIDLDGVEQLHEVTGSHPYFTQSRGWVEVKDLQVGDLLQVEGGGFVVLSDLQDTGVVQTTYNFEVKDINTYYVGSSRVLVHNCNDVVNKTDRLKKHVLNGELDAARREAAGEVVARKADGTPWDHVTELRDAQRGLLKRIKSINKQLGSNSIGDATRSSLQKELGEASRLLDKTEGYLPRK